MISEIHAHLERKQYIEIMEATKCGWDSKGKYKDIGCPSCIPFISSKDEPHPSRCIMECEACWQYVLDTKWAKKDRCPRCKHTGSKWDIKTNCGVCGQKYEWK